MSFLNIKDPEERDAKIADYLALKKRLQERNMEERSDLVTRQKDLEETYKPIVTSNREMAAEIVKDLFPIKEELKEINENLEKRGKKRKLLGQDYGPLAKEFFQKYLNANNTVDTTFGIRFVDGKTMMGDEVINIDGDNIVVNGAVFKGTPGLWTLITGPNPKSQDYTREDLERYKEILYETNALYRDYDSDSQYPRANRSKKWKKTLHHIWEEFKRDGIVKEEGEEAYYSAAGDGIYVQKNGRCFGVRRVGNGIHLSPRPMIAGIRGNGLYLRRGVSIYDGRGLLLGSSSPFKNIPILKWIL